MTQKEKRQIIEAIENSNFDTFIFCASKLKGIKANDYADRCVMTEGDESQLIILTSLCAQGNDKLTTAFLKGGMWGVENINFEK